jgi:hypothetical protein
VVNNGLTTLEEVINYTKAGGHQRHVAAVGLNVRAQLVDGIDHALPVRILGRLRRICKCFGVDEGHIRRAVVNNGLTTLEEVINYTKAARSASWPITEQCIFSGGRPSR